jgi:predicted O-methyltransferase YrrM
MTLPVVKLEPKWHSQSVRAYMIPGELEVLLTLIDSVYPTSMIEFGVNEGRTALAVLHVFPEITRYVGVDVAFDHQLEIAAQQCEVPHHPGHMVAGNPRFELIIRENDDVFNEVDFGLFDVAFIDGDHGYNAVIKDHKLAMRLVRKGGIIIHHDYTNPTVQSTEALDALYAQGHKLNHVEGFWLAYEYV